MKYLNIKGFLASFVFIFAMPIQAQTAEEEFTESQLTYRVLTVDAATQSGTVEVKQSVGTLEGTLQIGASVTTSMSGSDWTFAITSIADEAFKGTAISTLDLSSAVSLSRIGSSAFAECSQLQEVIFPAASVSHITEIGTLAFHHAFALKRMNLEDTHIEVLESFFSKNEADEVTISGLTELMLPSSLKEIKPYALQFLDLREVEIPSGVTTFGNRVLEGCIFLQKFKWFGAQITKLPFYTFLGDDKLEEVYLVTTEPLESDGLTDKHFYMNDKDLLRVYVTPESMANLEAGGYKNELSVFSTLVAYTLPDGIESVSVKQYESPREFVDGSDACYNIHGLRVSQLEQGKLYIRNGRKFIAR